MDGGQPMIDNQADQGGGMPEDGKWPTPKDLALLDALGIQLSGKRQKAIDARVNAGIDARWYGDVEAYEGRDEVTRHYAGLRAVVQGYLQVLDPKTPQRSTLVVNVTRGKVNSATARLQDVALPTDDRNWDLRASTVPELVEQMSQKHIGLLKNGKPVMVTDQGQQRQATMADYAAMNIEEAKKRAIAMRDEIDDQLDLSEGGCGYEGVVREMMLDERLLGTGVIKGPVITSRVKKVWMPITAGDKTVHVLQRVAEKKPVSARVNPWDIYPHPDCGEHAKKFPIWERIPGVTARDIRNYAGVEGYIVEQLKKVLLEGPKKPDHPVDKPGPQQTVTEETVFEAWEYHGDIDRDALEAAGCTCDPNDVFTSYSGSVVMINNTVIKADLEMLDTEEMPYDFFVTNKCSGSWAGFGKAFLARAAQRAITAGWRSMMDNAGQFVGPQIVINRTKIEPASPGDWAIRGMKVWLAKGDTEDVGKAFAVHEISAHQAEYAAIIKMGMDFLDDETALPKLAEGEQGTATDVLGGMNILLNASNTTMRRDLKCFDDQVTIPHIGRYVDWNMQYNPKSEIKGDFEVQARASGALLDSEIQDKNAANLLAIALNPNLKAGMKKWDSVRRVIRGWRYDPADFVEDDQTIKKNEEQMAQQQQPAAPAVQAAQIRAASAEKLAAAEAAEKEKDRQLQLVIERVNERIEQMKLTGAKEISFDEMKAELAGIAVKVRAQIALSQETIAHEKDQALAGHIMDLHKHENPSPQVLAPPSEPGGRAKAGNAWQQ